MPLLINDHDLLLIEPALFTAGAAAATSLINVNDASVTGTSLTSASAGFEAKQIDAGHVAVVAGIAVEVLDRPQATELQVTLPRVSQDDPSIGPGNGVSLVLSVPTFERVIQQVQERYLLLLGAQRDEETAELVASVVTNLESLKRCMVLRTLADAFAAAAAANPEDASLAARASLYRDRANAADQHTGIEFDADGDGEADGVRRLGIVQFRRA